MAISVTHTTVAVGTDAGNGEIRKAQWNEAHTITGVPDIFAQSAVAASVGATTSETVLATISFSGGEMGANGVVEVWASWSNNNSANTKSFRIRAGGIAGTAIFDSSNTTNVSISRPTHLVNVNSESSQKTLASAGQGGGVGSSGGTVVTTTVNTASAWDLVLTGQKANSGDTLTLEGYIVQVFKKA